MRKHEKVNSYFTQHWCRGIFAVLLFFMSITVSAQGISVRFPNVTVEQALEILKNQEGYSFVFKTNDVNLNAKVNGAFQGNPIEQVLDFIFKGQSVSFEINGKMVLVNKKETTSQPTAAEKTDSRRTITGRITDNKGEPLIGVNIVVKGEQTGTVSDFDGSYYITVPDKSTLQYSYLGFETQEVKIGRSDVQNISLKESLNSLDEIIVIGYGVMKKSDLTGAVSSVKTEDLPMASNTSISHMLSGKAAGVTVVQNSAQPGGGIEMLVRGAASTGAGNEPLYIIDGFPVGGGSVEPASDNRYSNFGSRNPLNSINPNDIESIEILKDASSTAIYGARAANGVIIITTKKGREGDAVVSYNFSYGVQNIANRVEMLTATEFMKEANKFAEEKWYYDNRIYPYGNTDPSTVTERLKYPYTDSQIANAGQGTDWYDLVTRQGMIHQHNVSVSGGTSKLKYMASFNYFDQDGVVKNSDFTRYTGRINVEHQLSKIFTYGINATHSNIKSTNIPLGTEDFENSGLLNSAMAYDPTVPVKDKNGNYVLSELMTTVPNPVSMLEITDYTKTKRLLVNAYIQAEPIKGLIAKLNLGFDDQNGIRNSYLPKTTLYGQQEGGKASKSLAMTFDKLLEATLNYNFQLNDSNKFNVLAGYSFQGFENEGFAASNSKFFTDAFLYNSLASGEVQRPTVSSNKSKSVLLSYFGRVNYNLMDKYLFTFTARVDGSDKFGVNNRYGFFPSGAVAWRIKQEDFLKDVDLLSDLKLRVGLGQTGNSNIGNSAFEYYTAAWYEYVFGNSVNIGTTKSQMANPDLKWETTTELNVGLDFGFFNQRIGGSVEFFKKEVKDLLGLRKLKSFMEVSTVAANIGKTQSTGLEISLRSTNFTGQFKWNTELNFTRYVDRWKERNPDDVLNPWQKNDDPIRAHYSYLSDGILGIDEAPPAYMPNLLPGQYKVKDVNGYVRDEFGNLIPGADGKVQYMDTPDGIIDEADIVLIGTYDPGFTIGLGNTFEYKGFDLNIFFYGMFDRIVNNETRGKYSVPEIRRILNGQNMMTEVSERWSKDNPDATLPSGFVSAYPQPSDYLWEKAWFIRCKNITLGYTLPKRTFEKVFSSARIYVDVSNPFVITPYSGNDPETDFKAGYPNQHTYSIGLNVTF
ncbi:SusC/RagA family TonB-linked outer membrane protein [Paludibacter sp. 221]|uniref:TonB-dependent receptor n=1 Tax=Paludibacter sp. 221 TaxID=2302939 RepID=UPI0013D85730|nr:TonB-dependent receptor [Paludibacter sp. 221]NDV46586.1 SusC/RagA family TonB-linked outer membrane protein [Paludibacter sp. 221]